MQVVIAAAGEESRMRPMRFLSKSASAERRLDRRRHIRIRGATANHNVKMSNRRFSVCTPLSALGRGRGPRRLGPSVLQYFSLTSIRRCKLSSRSFESRRNGVGQPYSSFSASFLSLIRSDFPATLSIYRISRKISKNTVGIVSGPSNRNNGPHGSPGDRRAL